MVIRVWDAWCCYVGFSVVTTPRWMFMFAHSSESSVYSSGSSGVGGVVLLIGSAGNEDSAGLALYHSSLCFMVFSISKGCSWIRCRLPLRSWHLAISDIPDRMTSCLAVS